MKKKLIMFFAGCGLILSFFLVVKYFGSLTNESTELFEPNEEAEEEAGGPDEAFKWRQLSEVDENGVVPKDALLKALNQRNKVAQKTALAPETAGLSRARWVFKGPQNVGGRTRAVVINPQNPNIIFAGSAGGGLWKTVDGGQNWSPVNDYLSNLAVSSLAIDPNNPNILYCGTGEGYFNSDSISGAGIFKSSDQGNSWSQLSNTSSWTSVDRISVAPGNSNLILASTVSGIRRSTDGGNTWTIVKSVQRSFFVAFNPTDANKAIAQVIDYNFSIGQWFQDSLYSTNGGQTWQTSNIHTTEFLGRIEMAYSASNPNYVYAVSGGANAAISRSTDGGVTFTQTSSGALPEPGQLWYDNAIWVSPTDPNFIVVGMVNIYRSTNGGATLTKISNGYLLTDQPHPDQHCVVPDVGYNGTSNKRVYVCNDGGVFRADDITTAGTTSGWVSLNRGYQTSQFYGAVGNGATGLVYGGLQDNGTLVLTAANSNAGLSFGGDGGFAAIDSTDENYCYGEYTALQLHRSANRGGSAQYIYSGISDAGSNANFIAPFILDPNNQSRMLAGGRSLWRSDNVKTGTPTWTAIRPGGTDNISAIAVAKGNSNIIWVAQNDGKIYKTVNGLDAAPTWQTVDDNSAANPLPNRYPTRIIIDQDNSNIVFIAFGGFSDSNLQRTTNGGQTWADITGTGTSGLPFAPIRGIARHPSKPGSLYVGTEVGIFASADNGQTWSTLNEGPASVSIYELSFMNNSTTLLAATHGRGIWTIQVGNSVPYDFDGDGKSEIGIFRPSAAEWWYQRSSDGATRAVQFGSPNDIRVTPADFTGDGKTDIAFFRPSDGNWFVIRSEDSTYFAFPFGSSGDIPAPADFDGDGKADAAVFRPSQGVWYVNKSSGGTSITQFGIAEDKPVVADYDGDGKADIAIFRPSNNSWWHVRSSDGEFRVYQFALGTDKPVIGDWTGDGKADLATYRPSTGEWFIRKSEDLSYYAVPFGAAGDIPAPGDYDGDGKLDTAVYRPTQRTWYINRSTAGILITQFGIEEDKPLEGSFIP